MEELDATVDVVLGAPVGWQGLELVVLVDRHCVALSIDVEGREGRRIYHATVRMKELELQTEARKDLAGRDTGLVKDGFREVMHDLYHCIFTKDYHVRSALMAQVVELNNFAI